MSRLTSPEEGLCSRTKHTYSNTQHARHSIAQETHELQAHSSCRAATLVGTCYTLYQGCTVAFCIAWRLSLLSVVTHTKSLAALHNSCHFTWAVETACGVALLVCVVVTATWAGKNTGHSIACTVMQCQLQCWLQLVAATWVLSVCTWQLSKTAAPQPAQPHAAQTQVLERFMNK